MAFDYSGLNETAKTLVSDFGKPMTLIRATTVPSGTKPWLTQQGSTATADEAAQSIAVTGVLLGPGKTDRPDTNVDSKIGRILLSTETTLPETLDTGWKIDDGEREYEVTGVTEVNPGPIRLLYKLAVAL